MRSAHISAAFRGSFLGNWHRGILNFSFANIKLVQISLMPLLNILLTVLGEN